MKHSIDGLGQLRFAAALMGECEQFHRHLAGAPVAVADAQRLESFPELDYPNVSAVRRVA